MPEREKVINALACKADYVEPQNCTGCPYHNADWNCCDQAKIYIDAIVLLRGDARVLTLEETITLCDEPVWIEENTLQGSYGAWGVVKGLHERYEAVNIGGVRFTYWPRAKYNITWRCWSALPTEEQRKEARWEWQK